MGLGLRRRLERTAARHPVVRRALTRFHLFGAGLIAREHTHPIDRRYGISTQTPVPLYLLKTGSSADGHMIPYAGCVPGVLRHVLGTLPDDHEATFVDLGCGKGRALAVASEFPFRAVMGIELNPDLVAVARRNARRVAAAHPTRPAIRIDEGDASAPALPKGDVVLFLYHPFGEPLIRRLTQHLVQSRAPGRVIHVIYENPVHGAVFDDHPAFRRIFAAMLPCTAEERRFAFDADEAIAIWRLDDDGDDAATRRPIVVTKPGYRAVIRD